MRLSIQFLSFCFFGVVVLFPNVSLSASLNSDQEFAWQAISYQLTRYKTMTGRFLQFHPDGYQSEGTFYLKRPGKVRFDYRPPTALMVKSDGNTIGVHNRQLDTWDYYSLEKTPLSLILSDAIDVSSDSIVSVDIAKDLVTVVLSDKSLFGDSTVSLMFDPQKYDLRQWTVRDRQGIDTTVVIYDVKTDIDLKDALFALERKN